VVVIVVATLAVFGSFSLFGKLGSTFMPDADQSQFAVTYRAQPGIGMERSEEIARTLVAEIRKDPGVDYTYATVGGTRGEGLNQGNIYVRLKDPATRRYYLAIMADLRGRLKRFPALRTAVSLPSMGGTQAPIQASLRGDDLEKLRVYGRRLQAIVAKTGGAVDVDTSEEDPRPEFRIRLDRKRAGDLGLDLGTVATTVRGLVAGQVVSQFEDTDGDSYDVRLRVETSQRSRSGDLLELDLPGQGGRAMIPLSQVASVDTGSAPSSIHRLDLMREIRITANTQNRSLGEVVNEIKLGAAGLNLPPGYGIIYTGQAEEMTESFGYVGQSLILAIVLIYAILASQFRSFAQPFAIMLSLPLSLLGVAGMLYLVKDTLNMMSMIGVILLMGLVTKNAILLVDFTNVQRRSGATRREALIEAARVRLRPIMMTTLAMIFGMLPLVFELGSGAEFRAPMARAVVGGLITSTLLTLIVVPVVYTYLDDLGEGLARRWNRKTPVSTSVDHGVTEQAR
jgi:HAE1 family hydrophobic/amphiphilic exporter-1